MNQFSDIFSYNAELMGNNKPLPRLTKANSYLVNINNKIYPLHSYPNKYTFIIEMKWVLFISYISS